MIKLPKLPQEIDNLKIVEHKIQKSFDPKSLSLWLSEEQKKGYIEGNKLKEILPNNVANACVLDYLFEHQELIPEKWKNKTIFFWGTIYRDADGVLYVRCLRLDVGAWYRGSYRWLVVGWDGSRPAALLASPLNLELSRDNLEIRISELEKKMDKLLKIINL